LTLYTNNPGAIQPKYDIPFKYVELRVFTSGGDNYILKSATRPNGRGFNIHFSVNLDDTLEPDTATIKLHGFNKPIRKGDIITVRAFYIRSRMYIDPAYGRIFSGSVKFMHEEYQDGERIITLQCINNAYKLLSQKVGGKFPKGTLIRDVWLVLTSNVFANYFGKSWTGWGRIGSIKGFTSILAGWGFSNMVEILQMNSLSKLRSTYLEEISTVFYMPYYPHQALTEEIDFDVNDTLYTHLGRLAQETQWKIFTSDNRIFFVSPDWNAGVVPFMVRKGKQFYVAHPIDNESDYAGSTHQFKFRFYPQLRPHVAFRIEEGRLYQIKSVNYMCDDSTFFADVGATIGRVVDYSYYYGLREDFIRAGGTI